MSLFFYTHVSFESSFFLANSFFLSNSSSSTAATKATPLAASGGFFEFQTPHFFLFITLFFESPSVAA